LKDVPFQASNSSATSVIPKCSNPLILEKKASRKVERDVKWANIPPGKKLQFDYLLAGAQL